jgi:flagellar basal-body rod modification protein FlgD
MSAVGSSLHMDMQEQALQDMEVRRPKMDPREKEQREMEIRQLNFETFEKTEKGRAPKHELGQEDFLQLMMKQLEYQDPLSPMEDKEFIAQMAQFSSLKEITAMNQSITTLSNTLTQDFAQIASMISNTEAASSLGKTVELHDGYRTVQGVVHSVTRGGDPQIMVDGFYYDWGQVTEVYE